MGKLDMDEANALMGKLQFFSLMNGNLDADAKIKMARQMTKLLWDQYMKKRLAKGPETLRAELQQTQQSILEEGKAGLMQYTTLLVLRFVDKHLEEPHVLRGALELLVLAGLSGGTSKVLQLFSVISSDEFKQADQTTQDLMFTETLGPLLVKSLQTLNTMPDLFPEHVTESLTQLYANNLPVPYESIKNIIERDLGMPIEKAFKSFNPTSLHTGSIAQVHEAVLHNGTRVAVKVVKDEAISALQDDLALLEPLSRLVEQAEPKIKSEALVQDLSEMMIKECDMRHEALKLQLLGSIYEGEARIKVPKRIKSHSGSRVLTMTFEKATSLENFKGQSKIAQGYLNVVIDQVLRYGACQSDPHFANMPYNPDTKKFVFLDAGLVYFMEERERLDFCRIMTSLVSKDASRFTQSFIKPPPDGRMDSQQKQLREKFQRRIQSALSNPKLMSPENLPTFLSETAITAESMGLTPVTVNPLLWKTLFTAINVTTSIDPKVNISRHLGKSVVRHLLKHDRRFLAGTSWHLVRNRVFRRKA